ncbi:MAG TPA: MarR family transcriptional regulator [Nocardioides sp.]|nr:MarR family transcriptional regulator [Nocardioides sp.]
MTTPDDVERLSSELVVHAARLVRVVRRSLAYPAGVRTLSLLDELGPTGISALATADHCSQPTMTGQVRQLEEQGWVARSPNPADARGTLVALTDAGRAELARVRTANARLVADRLRASGAHDARDLATAVAVLRDVLDRDTTRRDHP